MTPAGYYAHSLPGRPPTEWHKLEDHLRDVAALTADFASFFSAAEWGRLAGLWHDLGKYLGTFQRRLMGDPERVDHAIMGALLAVRTHPELGRPLAFAISGHHGGLPNPVDRDATAQAPFRSG